MIKVSILIPAYNVEQYIKRCIISAIEQTLQEIEIIIVNDGSTDSTLDIINAIAKNDSRICIINKENKGLPAARNSALSIAKGKYIQHLDGDDWIDSEACFSLYKCAEEYQLDMIMCNWYKLDENKNIKIEKINKIKPNTIYQGKELIASFYEGKIAASVCTQFTLQSLYDNVTFTESLLLGEDLATTPKLLLHAKKIGVFDNAFLHYTTNPNSLSRGQLDSLGYEMILAMDDGRRYIEMYNTFDAYKSLYKSKFDLAVFLFFNQTDPRKARSLKAYAKACSLISDFYGK